MKKLTLDEGKKKRLLNVLEAAHKLGVSQNTIRKWQHQGKLPYIKLFGAIRFDNDDLDRLIESLKTRASI